MITHPPMVKMVVPIPPVDGRLMIFVLTMLTVLSDALIFPLSTVNVVVPMVSPVFGSLTLMVYPVTVSSVADARIISTISIL